jgi:hypothetical protein
LADWVKQILTRKVRRREVVEPNEKLVYAVKFSLAMTACLSLLEVAHMAFLRSWNAEIFVAISSLITFVSGIIIGQKAG